ncbi:MAG: amidase [Actinomycetota bacterium]|nr:amidase [Actinomycetota bacterium]
MTELAVLLRTGELSSRELVEASLARIEALNGRLNAFIATDAERALAAAEDVRPGDERPFAGVPLAIKDLTPVNGLPLTFGSSFFGDYTPTYDSHVVRRFREAGFIPVGMTNMPEMGITPVSEPRRYGPTRNPWATDRTPGGSSGGSAAAVASGMVPIAHSTDGGGSTRIPAACCGLVGLKPARGRISLGPDAGEHFTTVSGCLTRTVKDTAAALDVLAGYELGDATWAPPPAERFAASAAREPGNLRIAFTLTPPITASVDAECATAVHHAAMLLDDLGHDVEEIEPPWAIPELLRLFTVSFGASIALVIALAGRLAGREPAPEDVEPLSWELFTRAAQVTSMQHLAAVTQLQAFARGLIGFLAPYDALLMPSLAQRPVAIGEIDSCSDDPMADFARAARFTPFTAVANITGLPAISLPFAHGRDGLPTGIALLGRPADEGSLLSLATQIEAARPWADRRPPVG